MKTRKLKAHDLIKCDRCGKVEFAGTAEKWNAVFGKGIITGFLCPDCQTDEEDLEAQVNEAVIDYSKTVTVSTIPELLDLFRPLWGEALRIIANGEAERGNALLDEYIARFRKGFNYMNRHNLHAQLADDEEARALLCDLKELPR